MCTYVNKYIYLWILSSISEYKKNLKADDSLVLNAFDLILIWFSTQCIWFTGFCIWFSRW